jgi:DNA repair protein RadC
MSKFILTPNPLFVPKSTAIIKGSLNAFDLAFCLYDKSISIYEEFHIILLDRSNTVIDTYKISQGGITGTTVDVRLIAKYALDNLATGIILVHNHPSGQTRPSQNDKALTEKIKQGLKLFDIDVIDHIILCPQSSF